MVARKHRQKQQWLITAWAAGGPEREVRVEIPELGKTKLLARPSGTVYTATVKAGKTELTIVDKDDMNPTAGLSA